ncbi:MAG: biotin/lipoyl-binding protein [Dehalococcoidia bacterium]|nr:biotin/lipoyl-binding protein [Dehalococcoidia bacterium]
MEGLLAPRVPARHWAAAAAALTAARSRPAPGPWGAARWIGAGGAVCWLSSGPERRRATVRDAGQAFEVDIDGERLTVTPLGDHEGEAAYRIGAGQETVLVSALPPSHGADLRVRDPKRDTVDGVTRIRVTPPPALPRRAPAVAEGVFAVTAPLSGTVTAVQVAVGDVVEVGQLLVVLEAMKMEHRIVASESGTVREVLVAAGDVVREGTCWPRWNSYKGRMPARTARATASVRLAALSLPRTVPTWNFTVCSLMPSWSAIALLGRPRATRRMTSSSRLVRAGDSPAAREMFSGATRAMAATAGSNTTRPWATARTAAASSRAVDSLRR